MHRLATAAMLLSIVGCSNTAAQPQPSLYDAKAALIAADNSAIKYITQPLCGPKHPVACSDTKVITRIKAAEQSAYEAVRRAETGNADDITAANDAVAKLVSATPTVK